MRITVFSGTGKRGLAWATMTYTHRNTVMRLGARVGQVSYGTSIVVATG